MRYFKTKFLAGSLMVASALGSFGPYALPTSVIGSIDAYAAETSFSSYWYQDGQGNWKIKDSDGNPITDAWVCDDAVAANGQNVWYLIDANGNMVTAGLVQDKTGNYYSLETEHNGYYGMLRYQSGNYDGANLSLESSHNGSFAGILNQDGIDALNGKYGVTQVSIDNSNCIYTGTFASSGEDDDSFGMEYDSQWQNYSDTSVSSSANDFTNGNYSRMTASQKEEVQNAINDFKNNYITSGMNDFQKEIQIIRWLVENCSYEKGDGWENATAYSCIVNGKAQCAGYADAFLQTAKSCGLEARYVYNTTHAWNLIKLEGDWYHVDVTWEDPIGSNSYGFSNLRNNYINLEDSQIRSVNSHHQWNPSSAKATGVKYGPKVVAQYLKDGTIDTSKGKSYQAEMDEYFKRVENADGSNRFVYSSVEQTSQAIANYIGSQIDSRNSSYSFVLHFTSAYASTTTGNYTKANDLSRQIEERVKTLISSKYGDVLRSFSGFHLYLKTDANSCYYAYEKNNLHYQEGKGKMLNYTVHFKDLQGNELGTQAGSSEKGKYITLSFPDGYTYVSNSKEHYKVNQGDIRYTGKTFTLNGTESADVDITVKEATVRTKASYAIKFIDAEGNKIPSAVGSVQVGQTEKVYFPKGYQMSQSGTYTIEKGNVEWNGDSFTAKTGDRIEVTVQVEKISAQEETETETQTETESSGESQPVQ